MYTHYFRFSEPPFSITPDPAFLYLSPRHHEALAHLLYGTGESGGFVQLTGEVGTGKTTVIRTLLEQRMPEVDVALILNPRQTAPEFLQSICDELGVAYAPDATLKVLVDALNEHLLATHAQHRRTVLIIDEAQNLSEDLLEQVRLLTNLETHKQKLLRIMLIGQPELDELLARPALRQLAQRITARFHLTALDRDETAEYIAHRLRVAGGEAALFEPAAVRAVYRHSGGVPRLINVLCDRALLAAYGAQADHVSKADIDEAARGLKQRARPAHWSERLRPALPWIPGVALAGMMGAAWLWSGMQSSPAPPAPVSEPAPASTELAVDEGSDSTTRKDLAPAPIETVQDEATVGVTGPQPTVTMPTTTSAGTVLDHLPPLGEQVALLLGQWDAQLVLDGSRPVCTAIRDAQMRCLREQGDWQRLRQLDRPAILTLVDEGGARRYVLLRQIFDTHAQVVADGRPALLSLEGLDALWNGEFLMFWRDQGPDDVIRPGDDGAAVAWLRRSLAAIEDRPLLEEADTSFDSALRARVEDFQRRRGLSVDGHVGEKTRFMMMHALYPNDGPRLKAEAS